MRISCCHYFMEPASNSGTPAIQRFCCGVGHVIDDILRQLLFSFRLVFFMKVLSLSAANAGWLILQKQLAHVVFSPLCAFLVDSINIPVLSQKLGRRKSWLVIANIVEAVFIPLFFSTCFPCQSDGGQWQLMVYIGVLNTILAFAGTLMNVGHLSIIPVIAKNQSEALEMSAWRTAFSFLSGIITLVVAWAIFGQDNSEHLTAENAMDFTVMSLILVGIGLLFCLIFHIGTKEPSCQINKKLSVTATGIVRKSSYIASNLIVQSMTFMGTDTHKKEAIRDRFLGALKATDSVTGEGNPARKKSFARHFISALFAQDEEEKNNGNDASPSVNEAEMGTVSKSLKVNPSPSSESRTQNDDEVLNDVKQLPQERKLSVLLSIVYGLVGLDTDRDDQVSEKVTVEKSGECNGNKRPTSCTEIHVLKGSSGPNGSRKGEVEDKFSHASPSSRLGVDNKGLECSETEICPSFPDPETTNLNVDALTTSNCKRLSAVSDDPESALPPKTIRAWLKDPRLYMVAIIFTCTKVLQDVAYAYLPLFLIYRVDFGKDAIAYLPLVMLISATVSSGLSNKLVKIIGNKNLLTLSALFVIGAGVWFYFITQSNKVMTYPAVVLLGSGFSIMFVTALSFAAELIGDNKGTSGVVFAFMGLMASVTGGSLFGVIQKLFPQESNSEDCKDCGDYVRHVFSFVPGILAAICVLTVLLLQVSQTIKNQNVPKMETENETVTDTRF